MTATSLPDPRACCTGLVLAGGRGARLGGLDKGLIELHGRVLAAAVLSTLRPQVRDLLVSANRNVERYATLGAPVVTDGDAAFAGPLAGLQAGLAACRTEWLVSAPCDQPHLPADLAARLLHAAGAAARPSAYAVLGGESSYVCALLHASLRSSLGRALGAGRRGVRDWLAGHGAVPVAFTAAAPLNLNTPADLARAVARG